jgi:nucleotide-binding universal stress UspA family protein
MNLQDKHILIAVDESDNAKRAVLYVADLLGGFPGFRVTLLHVIPEPPEDYFETEKERLDWIENQSSKMRRLLENYRNILIQSGFPEDKVKINLDIRPCSSIAECILDELNKIKACTVVLGRRGISRKEELIFGSTSNRILHEAKNCSVWVIE